MCSFKLVPRVSKSLVSNYTVSNLHRHPAQFGWIAVPACGVTQTYFPRARAASHRHVLSTRTAGTSGDLPSWDTLGSHHDVRRRVARGVAPCGGGGAAAAAQRWRGSAGVLDIDSGSGPMPPFSGGRAWQIPLATS